MRFKGIFFPSVAVYLLTISCCECLNLSFPAGWRGTRAAVLLIVGFGAVLFTFFGNYIFSGLHSYL
jgi:hypothetical protein